MPLLCDPYSKNRTTGSFILIDEATGITVVADPGGVAACGGDNVLNRTPIFCSMNILHYAQLSRWLRLP